MKAGNGTDDQKKTTSQSAGSKVTEKVAGKQPSSPNSTSESSEGSDVEVLTEEPSPIPSVRPSDPVAAVQYDTLKTVWYPRKKRPDADRIRNAIVAFKDAVKGLRDDWKEKSQAMKTAENKGENDKANELKKDVVLYRHLLDTVVCTTLEKGHPAIIKKYVLSFYHLISLTDHCHGHRSQKRNESLFHVILLPCIARTVS